MNSTFNSFGSQVMTYTNCRFKEQPWILNSTVNTLPHFTRMLALSETGKYQVIIPAIGNSSFLHIIIQLIMVILGKHAVYQA
jgi:hypothetical protein